MATPVGDALWMLTVDDAPSYDQQEMRRLSTPLMWPHDDGLGTRGGVRPGPTRLTVAGYQLTVAACSGIVYPGASSPWAATDGPYQWALLPGDVTISPSNAQARLDRIVLRIQDDEIDSSGQRRAIVAIKAGTPASVPTAPDVSAGELNLGTISIGANGTPAPTIASPPDWYVALGGILPVATESALPSTGKYDGMAAYVIDQQALKIVHGGQWSTVGSRKGYQYWQTVTFTSSGSFSKASYPGLRAVRVKCQGGGGGGGGTYTTAADEAASSGGGGGGAYAERVITEANLATTETVTVGNGGAGGTVVAGTGSNGSIGGTSSFGTWVVAPGGNGGFTRAASTGFRGSSGATATTGGTGNLIIPGGAGGGGFSMGTSVISAATTDKGMTGTGGSSHLSGSGRSARGPETAPEPGTLYGGGGSGAVNGNGSVVIVEILV
jgi:hypothetical protein